MSNTNEKIKAIFPHIVVGGDIDKPYYSIYWYDVEKKTAYLGYSSYNLKIVHKWLQEEFEVVENDIDNLIARQQAKIERLKDILYDAEGVNLVNYWYQQCEIAENGCRNLEENNKKLQTEIEKLKKSVEIHKGIAEDWKYEAKKLKEMVGVQE